MKARVVNTLRPILLLAGFAACSPGIVPMAPRPVTPVSYPAPEGPTIKDPVIGQAPPLSVPNNVQAPLIRVALTLTDSRADLGSTEGGWSAFSQDGSTTLVSGNFSDVVTVSAKGGRLLMSAFGRTEAFDGTVILRATDGGILYYGGKRYRGEFLLSADESNRVSIINRLELDEYLRGVVPLEIGQDRRPDEIAAVAAQAIAARSYAYSMMIDHPTHDLTATVTHQAYGGRDAERPLCDSAIAITRGLVLFYDGKIAMTPYHSNSGGVTASANEIWKSDGLPYLVSVVDKIPGTNKFYSEDSPRFKWNRTYSMGGLLDVLNRTFPQYLGVRGKISRINGISEGGRSASGRLTSIVVDTDRGKFTVKSSDIRMVFRSSTGQILPSTLFTIKVEKSSGKISRVVFNGNGNGHGVGMDQWGAIYRARAGQDFLTILNAYYPGTTIGTVL